MVNISQRQEKLIQNTDLYSYPSVMGMELAEAVTQATQGLSIVYFRRRPGDGLESMSSDESSFEGRSDDQEWVSRVQEEAITQGVEYESSLPGLLDWWVREGRDKVPEAVYRVLRKNYGTMEAEKVRESLTGGVEPLKERLLQRIEELKTALGLPGLPPLFFDIETSRVVFGSTIFPGLRDIADLFENIEGDLRNLQMSLIELREILDGETETDKSGSLWSRTKKFLRRKAHIEDVDKIAGLLIRIYIIEQSLLDPVEELIEKVYKNPVVRVLHRLKESGLDVDKIYIFTSENSEDTRMHIRLRTITEEGAKEGDEEASGTEGVHILELWVPLWQDELQKIGDILDDELASAYIVKRLEGNKEVSISPGYLLPKALSLVRQLREQLSKNKIEDSSLGYLLEEYLVSPEEDVLVRDEEVSMELEKTRWRYLAERLADYGVRLGMLPPEEEKSFIGYFGLVFGSMASGNLQVFKGNIGLFLDYVALRFVREALGDRLDNDNTIQGDVIKFIFGERGMQDDARARERLRKLGDTEWQS